MNLFANAQLYINGKLRPATLDALYANIGPWTGEVIGYAADAAADDMMEAIAAARDAFDHSDWSTNPAMRRSVMTRFCEALKSNRGRLSQIARYEVGAAQGAINTAQVDIPLKSLDGLIAIYDRIAWRRPLENKIAWGVNSERLLVREASGVVGIITPWNAPFYITVGKVIPALLAGCTVVLKPAPDTPFFGAILGEIANEVGLPAGVLNVVTGEAPAMLGQLLVVDERVDVISFTGSTDVGRQIMAAGAPTLKRLFLELGGKSAAIILDDAPDFANSVAQSIVCFHAGQGCATITRLLVPQRRYSEALAALEQAYDAYSSAWGSPDAAENVMGPLISARQRERVMHYINLGVQEGARLLAGGQMAVDKGGGFFVEPTCFVDVTNDMTIAREEIFGPVLVVIPFVDDDDAVRIANDSQYGLSGSVTSGDPIRAMRLAERIRTGTISVNGGVPIAVDLPFGGYKQSGFGKEWGEEGFNEYLETKVIATAL